MDGAQEILPESFELYQDMESQRIGEMAVIPMEIADRELGYHPRKMEDTLRDTADFLLRHGRVLHPGRLCLQR